MGEGGGWLVTVVPQFRSKQGYMYVTYNTCGWNRQLAAKFRLYGTQLYSYGNTAYMGYTADRIFFSQTAREKVHAGRRFPLC